MKTNVIELIDQRINAAACNGREEVLRSLVELKSALGNQEQSRPLYLILAEDRDSALAEVARLRLKLACERDLRAALIEKRHAVEEVADCLRANLDQTQKELQGILDAHREALAEYEQAAKERDELKAQLETSGAGLFESLLRRISEVGKERDEARAERDAALELVGVYRTARDTEAQQMETALAGLRQAIDQCISGREEVAK